jgi:hypothetical protein
LPVTVTDARDMPCEVGDNAASFGDGPRSSSHIDAD